MSAKPSVVVIHSTLTGEEFEEAFARAVKADAKVVDEVGNEIAYSVTVEGEERVAQIFWDRLYTIFIEK